MSIWQLFFSELKYRWLGSSFAIIAVAVALFTVSSTKYLLENFDKQTQSEIQELQKRSQDRMRNLENEARVFAKSLGFNIFIYNSALSIDDFYLKDISNEYLTDSDANKLADKKPPLLNHLLPFLRHKIYLDAISDYVIIAGIEGEIFIRKSFQKPMEVKIEQGEVQLGYTIAKRLKLKVGDKIEIGKKKYQVTFCRKELGTKDDIVIFMNLKDAQEYLKLKGKITGILAISCNCAAGDVGLIRESVKKSIPHAAVTEFAIRANARQRARKAVSKAADEQIGDIIKSRSAMREKLKRFSALFSIVIIFSAIVLLIFIYVHNAKERRHEIAIFRTLGVSTLKILSLFAYKALFIGIIGTVLGYLSAIGTTIYLLPNLGFADLIDAKYFLVLFFITNGVSLLSNLVFTSAIIFKDPGIILNDEV